MVRFIVCVLALVSICSPVVIAQDPFPVRSVAAGQVVRVAKGNYLLTAQCNIQPGGKLVIEAGASIKVDGPGIVFNNRGSLEIAGTAADPVRVWSDPGKDCGSLFCPWTSGPRPQVSINHLDWTTTLNSNCLFLQATDFTIANSRITNRSRSISQNNRVCVAANSGSVGTISGCFLDGSNQDILTASAGLVIGNGNVQADVVELFETVIANTTDPIRVRKQFALVSGVIE